MTDEILKRVEKQPGRVVCLLLCGKQWVVGENSSKTSPRFKRSIPDGSGMRYVGTHAEMNALAKAWRIGGRVRRAIVLRWTKQGDLTAAHPCEMCYEALREAGVRDRDLWYSTWTGMLTRSGR